MLDTPPHTCGRCSGDVCPNGRRSRLKGLPGRTTVVPSSPGCSRRRGGRDADALHRPGTGASGRTRLCAPVHQHATARTGVRGERRLDRHHLLPSCWRCARQDAQAAAPAPLGKRLSERGMLEQVGHLHLFVREGVGLAVGRAHERQRRLVLQVGAWRARRTRGCALASSCTAVRRRVLPFVRRATRRCARRR
jgi:hypothetical protein